MRVASLAAEEAAARMQSQYPGMRISGTAHGFLSDVEQVALEERIRQARPEVLFVAMGIPRQEKWIWNPETPGSEPAGARISAGKSGNVLMSLP